MQRQLIGVQITSPSYLSLPMLLISITGSSWQYSNFVKTQTVLQQDFCHPDRGSRKDWSQPPWASGGNQRRAYSVVCQRVQHFDTAIFLASQIAPMRIMMNETVLCWCRHHQSVVYQQWWGGKGVEDRRKGDSTQEPYSVWGLFSSKIMQGPFCSTEFFPQKSPMILGFFVSFAKLIWLFCGFILQRCFWKTALQHWVYFSKIPYMRLRSHQELWSRSWHV